MAHMQVYLCPLLLALLALVFIFSTPGVESVDSYPSTCFFSVNQSSTGVWWFIDPNGHPFFSLGVVAVTYYGDRSNDDGQATYLPASSSIYGSQSAWADATVNRLSQWNFNTLGAWSDDVVVTKGMPYTIMLGLAEGYGGSWLSGVFPDVYDPDWVTQTYTKAKEIIVPKRNDPTLLGYFLDNEMHWGPDWRNDESILDQMLTRYDYLAPGRDYAWKWLRNRYNSNITRLNIAWNYTYATFKDITVRPPLPYTQAYQNDCRDFAFVAADRFFSVAVDAVRTYDTNHLLLGVKFAGAPDDVVIERCAFYNDVISIDLYPTAQNPYPDSVYMDGTYGGTGKPLLIAEFSYRGADANLPNDNTAGLIVPTQADRGQGYHNFTTALVELPFMVGYHWFEFTDQPEEGRYPDGENSNYGVVSIQDVPYTALVNRMQSTNALLPDMHGDSDDVSASLAFCRSELRCLNSCSGHGCCNTDIGVCECDSGYSSADCSVNSTQIRVVSFGSQLNANLWTTWNGWGYDQQYFGAARTSVVSSQLKLSIAPCAETACSPFAFSSGGVVTKLHTYGYGIYTAQIKAPANAGFSAIMELNSETSPKDSVEFHINGGTDYDMYMFATRSDQVVPSPVYIAHPPPINNPSLAFHNYTIHYFPDRIAFFVDSFQLGSAIDVAGYGASRPLALRLNVKAESSASAVSDVAYVRAVSYQLTNITTAVCV